MYLTILVEYTVHCNTTNVMISRELGSGHFIVNQESYPKPIQKKFGSDGNQTDLFILLGLVVEDPWIMNPNPNQ